MSVVLYIALACLAGDLIGCMVTLAVYFSLRKLIKTIAKGDLDDGK